MSDILWLKEDYDEIISKYEDYLNNHIANVKKGFDWLCNNLPQIIEDYDVDELGDFISSHDESKWSSEEFYPYAVYFNGDKNADDRAEVEEAFNVAWLHHQHNNPHHWQHWLLREDDGDMFALKMPYHYILEMISDWWAFSWAKGNLYEIFDWYEDNKPKMLLHEETQKTVESILEQIKNKLDSDGTDTIYDEE